MDVESQFVPSTNSLFPKVVRSDDSRPQEPASSEPQNRKRTVFENTSNTNTTDSSTPTEDTTQSQATPTNGRSLPPMLKPRSRRILGARLATSSNTGTRNLENESKEPKKLPKEGNKGEKICEMPQEHRQPGASQVYNEEVHKPSPENKCNKMPNMGNPSEDVEKTPTDENYPGVSRANDDDRDPPPQAKRKGRLEELDLLELIELHKIQKYANALQQTNVESSKALIARDNDAAHRKQVGNIKAKAKPQLLVPVVVPENLCILNYAKLIPDAKKVQEAADQLKIDIESASRMSERNQTTTDVEQQIRRNAGSTHGKFDASKAEDKVDEKPDADQSTPSEISYHQGDDDLFAPGGFRRPRRHEY